MGGGLSSFPYRRRGHARTLGHKVSEDKLILQKLEHTPQFQTSATSTATAHEVAGMRVSCIGASKGNKCHRKQNTHTGYKPQKCWAKMSLSVCLPITGSRVGQTGRSVMSIRVSDFPPNDARSLSSNTVAVSLPEAGSNRASSPVCRWFWPQYSSRLRFSVGGSGRERQQPPS